NTVALQRAGITKSTPDPFGGKIVRDSTGEPTGLFLDAAQKLIVASEPAASEDDRVSYILAGGKMLLRAACPSMQGGPLPLELARTYARLDAEGKLTQRAFLWAPLLAKETDFQAWLQFARTLPKEGKVHVVAFKGFADGTFAASTAALLAPYSDDPANSGEL